MSDLFLPPLPEGEMFVNKAMTKEWQDFFLGLYDRVGGVSSPSLDDIILGFVSGYTRESGVQAEKDSILEFQLPSQTGAEKRLEELKLVILQLCNETKNSCKCPDPLSHYIVGDIKETVVADPLMAYQYYMANL